MAAGFPLDITKIAPHTDRTIPIVFESPSRSPKNSAEKSAIKAGLVAITAPCAFVSIPSGALIGFVAGAAVDGLNVSNLAGGLAIDVVYLLVGVGLAAEGSMVH